MRRWNSQREPARQPRYVPAGTSWAPLSAGAVGIPSRRIAIAPQVRLGVIPLSLPGKNHGARSGDLSVDGNTEGGVYTTATSCPRPRATVRGRSGRRTPALHVGVEFS